MKGDTRCVDGRLIRHDPQSDDPDLETDRGACPDCQGRGCSLPKAQGISRMSDNDHALLISFDKQLTDDEMRDFHEWCKEWIQ